MPRRPALPPVPLALVALLSVAGSARAQSDDDQSTARYTLRAELGPELDTNAHRTEEIKGPGVINVDPVISPLARGVLTGSLSDVVGDGHQVALSATLAAKLFANSAARSEDVGIAESTAAWRAPLGERSAMVLAGSYYEAFQRDAPPPIYGAERRDFRSITPTLRLSRLMGTSELGLTGGYRVFVFKSDHTYDFNGPTAGLDLRWTRETADGAAEWDAIVRAAYEHRAFDGLAFVPGSGCPTNPMCPPTSGTENRDDHFVTGGLDVSRTGRVLIGLGYAFQLNLSNSFGETVTRHFAIARFATELPLDFTLAGRLEVLYARYAENVYVAQTALMTRPWITFEDENRNNARVELSRNIGERLQMMARYTFYANELGTGAAVTYRRHTVLVSLAFTLEK
jgi:hypothetical protein